MRKAITHVCHLERGDWIIFDGIVSGRTWLILSIREYKSRHANVYLRDMKVLTNCCGLKQFIDVSLEINHKLCPLKMVLRA